MIVVTFGWTSKSNLCIGREEILEPYASVGRAKPAIVRTPPRYQGLNISAASPSKLHEQSQVLEVLGVARLHHHNPMCVVLLSSRLGLQVCNVHRTQPPALAYVRSSMPTALEYLLSLQLVYRALWYQCDDYRL